MNPRQLERQATALRDFIVDEDIQTPYDWADIASNATIAGVIDTPNIPAEVIVMVQRLLEIRTEVRAMPEADLFKGL